MTVEGVAGDRDGAVEMADGVFNGQAIVVGKLMIEAGFCGKALAFVALEIAVGAIVPAIYVLHVSPQAIFKAAVDAETEPAFGTEVDE